MVSIAPTSRNDGPPPYSDGGINPKRPETPDWIIVMDENPGKTPTGEELEEKFWGFISNNKEVQELLAQCKTGTLGAYTLLEKKIAELKEEFIKQNPESVQADKNDGFNPFKYGAISQGGLVNLLT